MRFGFFAIVSLAFATQTLADDSAAIVRALTELAGADKPAEADKPPVALLEQRAAAALAAVNARETQAWRKVSSRQQWETFRDQRINALRTSLGVFPPIPADLHVRVTGELKGDGYRVENIVFESRPGLYVTANLYQPVAAAASMPGILICHSHHLPKSEGELQDMGISWARRGCVVLVMDVLGHGERRQHPFASNSDFPTTFKVSRQDYYFRYNLGIQLQLVGQSLSGWIAWDLMRGVDLLLARPGVDKNRIILLGAVASGGDLAAVTAALDPRISAVAVFNFGGPQPETHFPLPGNAEEAFHYAGSGSWESTRNLPLSGRDGFLPWVIDASIAPRRLIYGHEFSWDREHDPVWGWLQRIYGFYDAGGDIVGVHGFGRVTLRPPEASHCNNIGPFQLKDIHPALEKWLAIPQPGAEERHHFTPSELTCMTPALAAELSPKKVSELASQMSETSTRIARERLAALPPKERRAHLAAAWSRLLGNVDPPKEMVVTPAVELPIEPGNPVRSRRVSFQVEPDVWISILLLSPANAGAAPRPVVVGIAQEGHAAFLAHRAQAIADLLQGGATVCLADLRGTGDSARAADSRDRTSRSTDVSASWLMLGRPLLGQRLRDLRCVLSYLRAEPTIDRGRLALWGESFAAPNPPERRIDVPYGVDPFPSHSEPMGAIVAMLGGLFESDVRAICLNGGLSGYQSILQSAFCHVPHDIIVPGVFGMDGPGDLCDVAAAIAPRPLRMTGVVNGRNQVLDRKELEQVFAPAITTYGATGNVERLRIESENGESGSTGWLLKQNP